MCDLVSHQARLEQFNKLLVENSDFVSGKSAIFVKNGGQRPSLHFSEAPNQASGSMLAFVTVD